MIFLSVIIVYVIVQWWGSSTPFHRDYWFHDWHNRMKDVEFLNQKTGLVFAATVLGPALLLSGVIAVVGSVANWLLIFVFVPVLLYSLGRGEFSEPVTDYVFAWNEKNWDKALENYFLMKQFPIGYDEDFFQENSFENNPDVENNGEEETNIDKNSAEDDYFDDDVEIDEEDIFTEGDWTSLNHAMLKALAYKGFERIFAVMFWFVLIGPVGALIYRLVSLFAQKDDSEEGEQARRWLWLIEWPAVRLLGITFALTGSFVGCIKAWQEKLLCAKSTTSQVLEHYINGALDIDESVQLEDVLTQREFKEIVSLYSRTLIFWVCLLAVLTLAL